jgi:hypothetical protein
VFLNCWPAKKIVVLALDTTEREKHVVKGVVGAKREKKREKSGTAPELPLAILSSSCKSD